MLSYVQREHNAASNSISDSNGVSFALWEINTNNVIDFALFNSTLVRSKNSSEHSVLPCLPFVAAVVLLRLP